jgi:hypothetical protein
VDRYNNNISHPFAGEQVASPSPVLEQVRDKEMKCSDNAAAHTLREEGGRERGEGFFWGGGDLQRAERKDGRTEGRIEGRKEGRKEGQEGGRKAGRQEILKGGREGI